MFFPLYAHGRLLLDIQVLGELPPLGRILLVTVVNLAARACALVKLKSQYEEINSTWVNVMDKEIPGRSKCCKGEDTDEINIDGGRGWQGSLTLGGCSAHTCWLSEKGRVCWALWAPARGSLDPMPGSVCPPSPLRMKARGPSEGDYLAAAKWWMPGYYCCCSVAKSYPTLCDPMDCSTPGFPVLHHLLELAQTHVHWVSDAIKPSHHLSPPSPLALNLSQHQCLFQWVSSLYQVVKFIGASTSAPVLPIHSQGWFLLGWTGKP